MTKPVMKSSYSPVGLPALSSSLRLASRRAMTAVNFGERLFHAVDHSDQDQPTWRQASAWGVERGERFGDHKWSMVRWQRCCCSKQFGAGSVRNFASGSCQAL